MEILPNWYMTNKSTPAFYDLESGSCIEQTAKVYQAMQDIQKEYTKFSTDINQAIKDYETGLTTDFECFKQTIVEIVENHIKCVDVRISHHDKQIDEAVKAMTTNLAETVHAEVERMEQDGVLSQEVMDALGNYDTQLNEVKTSVETLNNTVTEQINKAPTYTYDSTTETLTFNNINERGV